MRQLAGVARGADGEGPSSAVPTTPRTAWLGIRSSSYERAKGLASLSASFQERCRNLPKEVEDPPPPVHVAERIAKGLDIVVAFHVRGRGCSWILEAGVFGGSTVVVMLAGSFAVGEEERHVPW